MESIDSTIEISTSTSIDFLNTNIDKDKLWEEFYEAVAAGKEQAQRQESENLNKIVRLGKPEMSNDKVPDAVFGLNPDEPLTNTKPVGAADVIPDSVFGLNSE